MVQVYPAWGVSDVSTDSPPRRFPGLSSLSLGIALCSLSTAMYQGYVQTRNLEIMQRDLARREQVRSCKEVIEAYFEAKLRIGQVLDMRARPPSGWMPSPEDAAAVAVSRFAALGTYLANFQGEEARVRYTALTRALEAAVARAGDGGVSMQALFEAADGLFAGMNEDCVRQARNVPD